MPSATFIIFVLSFLSFPLPARADKITQIDSIKTLCRLAEAYSRDASEGLSADYEPGITVEGEPVAPADLGVNLHADILPINIPITLDLGQKLAPVSADLFSEPVVADLTIYPDGRFQYNGQMINDQVYSICAKKPVLEDGQGPAQRLQSETVQSDAVRGELLDGAYPPSLSNEEKNE